MRILIVTLGYPPVVGGVELHTHEVARRLAERGHRVTVVAADRTHRLPPAEDDSGVEVIRVPAWPRNGDWSFAPRIATVAAERRWEVMHLQSIYTFVAPIAMLAARRANLPYVVTFHAGGVVQQRAARRLQVRALAPLLRRAARLIAVAPFEAELLGGLLGVDRNRFAVVSSGCDLPLPRKSNGRVPVVPTIISVGRLEPAKGHQRVIRSLPYLLEDQADLRLLVAGAGPYEGALRRLAVQLGVDRHVEIRSFAPDERDLYADELASAKAFVLVSDFETQPLSLLEAASFGVPAVVSDVPGLRTMVDDGLARSVPVTARPPELARAIRGALEAGVRPGKVSLPTWDECVGALEEVYREVVA